MAVKWFKPSYVKKVPIPQYAKRDLDKRRGSARERGYTSRWDKAAKAFLLKHPICVNCGKKAELVDHAIPHKGDMKLFWKSEYWQSMCHHCHNTVKRRLEALYERGQATIDQLMFR